MITLDGFPVRDHLPQWSQLYVGLEYSIPLEDMLCRYVETRAAERP